MNMQKEMEKYAEIFQGKDILVYGALSTAHAAVEGLQCLTSGRVIGCAVTKMGQNPREVCGVPVREIASYHLDPETTVVVIATVPLYYAEIQESLHRLGYLHVLTYCGLLPNLLFRLKTKQFLVERLCIEREE